MGRSTGRFSCVRYGTWPRRQASGSSWISAPACLPGATPTGSPTRRRRPRVVYVDNDPIVLAHARALLASGPAGCCDYVDADLRDVTALVKAAGRTLDLGQPVALMLLMVCR